MRILSGCIVLCLIPTGGCSCSGGSGAGEPIRPDGTMGDADLAPASPEPADPATLPTRAACPSGWRTVDGEPPGCEPFPESGPADCAVGQAHFPGTDGCARIGPACPSGDFPDDGVTGDFYVLAGASEEGTGERLSPFATLGAAMREADSGTTIILSRGTFAENVGIKEGVTVRGACVAETVIEGVIDASDALGTVFTEGTGGRLQDVTVRGARTGVWATPGHSLALQNVVIDGTPKGGVLAVGAVDLDHVVIRNIVSEADGRFGRGLEAGGGGVITGHHVIVERTRDTAVLATLPGSSVSLSDVVLRDTRVAVIDGRRGHGARAEQGATLSLERAVLTGNREVGVEVRGSGTEATLADCLIRDTLPRGDGSLGQGLFVGEGAGLTVRASLIENSPDANLVATDDGTTVVVEDSLLRQPVDEDPTGHRGIDVSVRASVELIRVLIEGGANQAVTIEDTGSSLDLTDVRIQWPSAAPGSAELVGLVSAGGPTVTGLRLTLDGNRGVAIHAAGTTLDVEHLIVTDTAPSSIRGGFGLLLTDGTEANVGRAYFEGNHEASIVAADEGTTLTFEDVDVAGTEPDALSGTARALHAQDGAVMTGFRLAATGSREAALVVAGAGTRFDAQDVHLSGTLERSCDAQACTAAPGGVGAGAYVGGNVRLRRFALVEHALAGLQVGPEANADIDEGRISDNQVGVNVHPGGNLSRLTDRIDFHGNVDNTSTDPLPLPATTLEVE